MIKPKFFIWILVLLLTTNSLAGRDRQVIRTSESSVVINEEAKHDLQYLYPENIDGIVYFDIDDIYEYKMNYNFLLDEIHFLTRENQSQALSVDTPFEKVVLGDHTFIYDPDNGYLELLFSGKTSFYLKREVNINTERIQRGAYGGVDHSASIGEVLVTPSTNPVSNNQITLKNKENVEIEINLIYNEYFLLEKDGELVRVNSRRQLLRNFPDHRSQLRSFIRQNNIRFSDIESMVKLAEYIETIY